MTLIGDVADKFIDAHDQFSEETTAEPVARDAILAMGIRFETDGSEHSIRQTHENGVAVASTKTGLAPDSEIKIGHNGSPALGEPT